MIKTIQIKDFALIDELEIDFKRGLNILTGQTGAGKSIIIGALNMILGERADTEVIRQGATKAIIEAIIETGEISEINQILKDNAIEASDELILRREIRNSGSRAFINDTPVTIGVLKQAGEFLVDLHGQHDHQFLLKDENHRKVIDDYETVKKQLIAYKKEYQKLSDLQNQFRKLKTKESELEEKFELYGFQATELEEANLDPEEEDTLEAEMNLLDNAEELDQKAGAISELGNGDDIGLVDLLNQVKLHLEDIVRIEPEFENYLEEINTARISIRETIQFAERYRNQIEFNPRRLEELRQRQSELNRLQKKYNKDIPGLIRYLNEIRTELSLAENFELELEKLQEKIDKQTELVQSSATDLHQARKQAGKNLADDLVKKLASLGISNATFEVSVEWLYADKGWINLDGRPVECTDHGCDDVKFFISTNKGEAPRPLAKIASGGEVSRVMLALKSIIASEQQLPVMIFDEIDTGISGHISEKVGRAMRDLAERCQIIAITHQPQIASQAHHHYRVEKTEKENRTVTRISYLQGQDHIREVAGLMSGDLITDSAIDNARELIEKSRFNN